MERVTKEMLDSVPNDVREAYVFAGGLNPGHPCHEWAEESMLAFIEWERSEALWSWRMRWYGGPVLAVLFIGWAWLMIWGAVHGFPS